MVGGSGQQAAGSGQQDNTHCAFGIWHFTRIFQLVLSVSFRCSMRIVKCEMINDEMKWGGKWLNTI
jgi:hypothetical protein